MHYLCLFCRFGLVYNIFCYFIIFDLWKHVCWCYLRFNCLLNFLSFLLFMGELGLGEGRLAVPVKKYPSSPKWCGFAVNFLGCVSAFLCTCGVSVVRAPLKSGV